MFDADGCQNTSEEPFEKNEQGTYIVLMDTLKDIDVG